MWKYELEGERLSKVGSYSRIGLLRSHGNLQSYWTTAKLWKLTIVLDCCEAKKTYSRIGPSQVLSAHAVPHPSLGPSSGISGLFLSPTLPGLLVSGGADGSLKVMDTRQNGENE